MGKKGSKDSILYIYNIKFSLTIFKPQQNMVAEKETVTVTVTM